MDSTLPLFYRRKSKRLKKTDACSLEDNISNLPRPLLLQILSLLPMKEAVRTSILSSKWRQLWFDLPNLDFELRSNPYHPKPIVNDFMDCIESALSHHDGTNIERFSLSCFEFCDFSRVYAWICTVLTCNLRELHIMLSIPSYGQLPYGLLTCKTLGVLKLAGRFVLNIPTNVCLRSLKVLHLRSVIYWDDKSVQKLLAGCPILEELEIIRFDWDNVLTFVICVPTLKRLQLSFHSNERGWDYNVGHHHKLWIYAPSLEYFKLHDHLSDCWLFKKFPHLIEAEVDVKRPANSELPRGFHEQTALRILDSISAARCLSLSTRTLTLLGNSLFVNLPDLGNLVTLKLGVDHSHGWIILPSLLEKSPKLEVLIFEEVIFLSTCEKMNIEGKAKRFQLNSPNSDALFLSFLQGLVRIKDPNANAPRFISMPNRVPNCLRSRLKTVEILQLVGTVSERRLVRYFLKNAAVLEQMTIRCHCNNVIWDIREGLLKFEKVLRNYTRASKCCLVKFIV
ncbi:hypothetical protein NMG60_11037088 [Bertholletia excelsa]